MGAQSTVSGTMQAKASRFTKPKVATGASGGVWPRVSNVRAPGRAMIKPIAAAVPTARWAR